MKIPRLKDRLNSRLEVVSKRRIVEIMHELEPEQSKNSLAKQYDRVTRALNGILNAYARDLPKGTHLRVRLNDCVTINICWMRGKPGAFAPYPNIWITCGVRLRGRLFKLRASEYRKWKADGGLLRPETGHQGHAAIDLLFEHRAIEPDTEKFSPEELEIETEALLEEALKRIT